MINVTAASEKRAKQISPQYLACTWKQSMIDRHNRKQWIWKLCKQNVCDSNIHVGHWWGRGNKSIIRPMWNILCEISYVKYAMWNKGTYKFLYFCILNNPGSLLHCGVPTIDYTMVTYVKALIMMSTWRKREKAQGLRLKTNWQVSSFQNASELFLSFCIWKWLFTCYFSCSKTEQIFLV